MTADQLLDEFDALPWRERDRLFRLLCDRVLGKGGTRYRGIDECFARYHTAMYDTSGVDCTEHNRKRSVVWARNIVAFQMLEDGFTTTAIARRVGLDHSTIAHCKDSVRAMMEDPKYYPEEMHMYRKFKNAIR